MKKLITIAFTAVLMLFGASPSFAATPEDCAESDDVPDGIECPVDGDNYPIVLPDGGETPPETTTTVEVVAPDQGTVPTPTAGLPSTGSSGVGGIMQVGALLVLVGLVVFVAARRRNPAPAA